LRIVGAQLVVMLRSLDQANELWCRRGKGVETATASTTTGAATEVFLCGFKTVSL